MGIDQRNHFLKMTAEILSRRRLCEFIATGGRVFEAAGSNGVWKDTTRAVEARESESIRRLDRLRRRLYPDLVDQVDLDLPVWAVPHEVH